MHFKFYMFSVYFENSPFWLILTVLSAIGLTFFLYFKDKSFKELERWKIILMSILRFSFCFLIFSLLLKPVLKISSIINQKPIVIIAQDNSKSILLNKDSIFYKTDYHKNIENFKSDLQKDYDVKFFNFSDNFYEDSTTNFSGKQTNISMVFDNIASRFAGMNVGAVVLASDGIYNTGVNPVYSVNTNYPIYSIALGDTIPQKDLIIRDLVHNNIALLGNTFPLKVVVAAEKITEKESELIITQNGNTIYSSKIELPENSTSKTIDIELKADKIGLQHYTVILRPLTGEISTENNLSSFVIKIIDNRKKILLLANAPHPDLGAITSALKNNPDFEFSVEYINAFKSNITQYNLIIIHQLPSKINNANKIISDIINAKIPIFFIIGNSSDITQLNNLNIGVNINKLSNSFDKAQPTLNTEFSAFNLDIEDDFFKNLAPFNVFFGDYKFTSEPKILMYQKINGITTQKPLIAFTDNQDVKFGFMLGDGFWRWRIDDFKNNSEHNSFNTLINRIVQFLSVAKIKDKLNVETKQIFAENERVILNAEFYNETFEIVKNLNIILTLTGEDSKEYQYNFDSFQNGYRLNLGTLKAGKYKYSVSTKFDGKNYGDQGEFIVKKIDIENLTSTANHNLLYQLAQKSGGKIFSPKEIDKLKQEIQNNSDLVTISHSRDKLLTLNDLWFLFFIILIFATVEWCLRKYFGSY